NGVAYTVVGVAPEEFRGAMPILTPALWMPLTQVAHARPGGNNSLQTRNNNFLNVIARPVPGVSMGAIEGRLDAIIRQLREEHPDNYRETSINIVRQQDAGFHPEIRTAQYGLTSIVMAVVVLLLLIACVNVANLLLSQARERSREMAIRLGLGARRSVIIRQLLTESVLLSVISGGIGVVLAWWAIGLANQIRLPVDLDMTPGLEVNPTVLLFTLGVSLLTGIIFGLAPALQATQPDLIPALKGESPSGGRRSRLTHGLVITQIALSIVLLVSAGLFLRNLERATQVDKGFDSSNLLIADLDPGLQAYSRARTDQFYQQLIERIRANPAVKSVALINDVQLGIGSSDWGVTVPGYTPSPTERMSIDAAVVSPEYFATLGTELISGREFLATDDSAAVRVLIVNQRFVDRFWPGQDGVGRTVRTGGRDHTVIGVVPTGKYRRLGEAPTAFMWVPHAQSWRSGMSLHIRTSGDPLALSSLVRSEVAALDPNLPVSNIRTMEQHLGIALLPARIAGSVLGLFGVLGLFLASIGIYGVMSGAVVQRTKEIGIRIAIGAAGGAIVKLLVREGLVLVGIGTVIGLAGALVASQLIRGMLYGGSGLDPATFAAVPLILGAVALLAIWIPSRRASNVDPIEALRRE
ncbi:MAG: ADOP family duplicated permease, partial [Gemmatimonadales bacterium]